MNRIKYSLSFLFLFELIILAWYLPGILSCPDSSIIYFVKLSAFICICTMFFYQRRTALQEDKKTSVSELLLFSFLASYKIIYLYANNVKEISFYVFSGVLMLFTILFLLFYYLFSGLLKNRAAGLYSAVLIMFLLHFTNIMPYEIICFNTISIDYFMLAVLIMAVFSSAYIVNPVKILAFFKKLIVILLIFLCFNLVSTFLSTLNLVKFHSNNALPAYDKKNCKRDIYFILLDMYSGKDTLMSYGYDNSAFYNVLKSYNFKVYENLDSNYNKTEFSVPSLLNCDYIENLPVYSTEEAIDESLIFNLARQNGYKIFYLNGYPPIRIKSRYYCKLFNDNQGDVITSLAVFFQHSAFQKIVLFLNYIPVYDKEYFISEAIENKYKKFVFLHFMMPHGPYLYDKNGNKNTFVDSWDFRLTTGAYVINTESYIGYLEYANKYIEELVGKILASSDTNPIIVIFGDHGIRKKYHVLTDEKLHIEDLLTDKNFLKAHFNTFLAYYNPDIEEYPEAVSLVNFFRSFTNETFGTNLSRLNNKKFYAYFNNAGTFKEPNGFWVR